MNRTTLRRSVVAGLLAAAMGLAGANPAQAREMGTAGQAWQWAQKAWTVGMYTLWGRVPAPNVKPQRSVEKEGWGLDPNGAPAPGPDAGTACWRCDGGGSIDPNG
ncbi:MAG TPA: hypothetical protein VLE27_05500 [Thermoanaerobaculia bacterium]|nr:hypothetical protein [Thermoanaerobaculia bacterium]